MNQAADGSLREIEIFIDLEKSIVDEKTGRIHVRGVASDNSVDFTNDIVKISQIGTSLSILNSGWGKFNYDHHKEIVGEITSFSFITPEEARERYGIETEGTVLEIEGFIYPITDKTPADSDVRVLHGLVAAGAKLGFSVQGGVGSRVAVKGKDGKMVNIAVPSFINQVAITGQPVNLNTICLPFAKSLAAFLSEGGISPSEWDAATPAGERAPAMLFLGDSSNAAKLVKSAMAALGSSGSQALAGVSSGGDATRLGAADKSGIASPVVSNVDASTRTCGACGGHGSKGAKFCANCGKPIALKKSVAEAIYGFSGIFPGAGL